MFFPDEGTAQRPPSAAVVIPVHHYEVVVLLALPCEETNGVSMRSLGKFIENIIFGPKLYFMQFHSAFVVP